MTRLEDIKKIVATPYRLYHKTPELSKDDIKWLIEEVERLEKERDNARRRVKAQDEVLLESAGDISRLHEQVKELKAQLKYAEAITVDRKRAEDHIARCAYGKGK